MQITFAITPSILLFGFCFIYQFGLHIDLPLSNPYIKG